MQIPWATYRQLLQQYLAPQGRAVALMAAFLIASIALQLLVPQIARSFINGTQVGVGEQALIQTALLFIGISAFHQVLRVLAIYWSERVAWKATNALRLDLTAHLMRLDLDFHQRHSPGELIERVDGDVNALAGFFSAVVIQLAGNVLLLLGIVLALAWVNIWLGVAFALLACLGGILLGWVRRFGNSYWQASRQHSATFYGLLGELIASTEDLRANGAVAYAMRRFTAQLRAWLPVAQRADFWSSAIWMAAMILFAASDALAYGIGGTLYLSGTILLGTVYMIIAYTAMLAAPIETIRTQLQELQQADAAITRIQAYLAIQPKLQDGTQSLPSGALAVEFAHAGFTYASDPILHDITFSLGAGRVLGLLGRTGSGKTTLARLLFRLVDPLTGEICVGGVDLRQAQIRSLRARIGFVTQDVQIFEASLRDNITCFAPNISDDQLLSLIERLGLSSWLARLPQGLDTRISTTTISAGEAQLIALARVFLKDPGLVILDEASSRLDPITEALLERALDKLLQGRTALIIAHRLATLDRATDILVLEQGRIIEHGPRQALLGDPTSRFAQLRHAGQGELLG